MASKHPLDRLVAGELLMVGQAAKYSGVSRDYLRHLVWMGDLPHVRVMGRILIVRAELDGYMEVRAWHRAQAVRRREALRGKSTRT